MTVRTPVSVTAVSASAGAHHLLLLLAPGHTCTAPVQRLSRINQLRCLGGVQGTAAGHIPPQLLAG